MVSVDDVVSSVFLRLLDPLITELRELPIYNPKVHPNTSLELLFSSFREERN